MISSPLTEWTARRIGSEPTREGIDAYQLRALTETLNHAKSHSRFYLERLDGAGLSGGRISEILKRLPFTYPRELAAAPLGFLCVPPHEVARIATVSWLTTSGTTGRPKRLYFSEAELERTADFFDYGMRSIARADGRAMIFMRGESAPNGVCDLLSRGLSRFGCEGISYGFISDPEDARRALFESGCDCAVAVAAQMARIAALPGKQPMLRTLLLAADNIPADTARMLADTFGCEVFSHYGSTETCFAGAVDCPGHTGMHIIEPDLIFEIIDPFTDNALPDGEWGELTVTTLTRRAMPLIRYRTGDFSRILQDVCRCGCMLKRLDNVEGHAEK